jgi:hypothetical protein
MQDRDGAEALLREARRSFPFVSMRSTGSFAVVDPRPTLAASPTA